MKAVLNKKEDGYSLTCSKVYDVELTQNTYNPITFELEPPAYIVKCDDSKFRKIEAKYFISIDEARNKKLDYLLK